VLGTGSTGTPCTTVRFADTNILLYAISGDPDEVAKASRANEILRAGEIALSTQVLQEFYVQATRETRANPITRSQALGLVESFLRFPIVETTAALVLAAAATHDRLRISYWDAAILEAARAAGCDVVLSEDLSHGTDYAGVRVENPFLDSGS
jgi:predicted nucleic acid-binding protein